MNVKIAVDKSEAWEIQDTRKDQPHGWIQWKGTDICMDVYCECGRHSHVDGDFVYYVKCPACGAVYFCNGHIELIKLEIEPDHCVHVGE
jgi:hypothetical protein